VSCLVRLFLRTGSPLSLNRKKNAFKRKKTLFKKDFALLFNGAIREAASFLDFFAQSSFLVP